MDMRWLIFVALVACSAANNAPPSIEANAAPLMDSLHDFELKCVADAYAHVDAIKAHTVTQRRLNRSVVDNIVLTQALLDIASGGKNPRLIAMQALAAVREKETAVSQTAVGR